MTKGKFSRRKQRAFLAAYSELGSLRQAAVASTINRKSHDRWMKEDPTYPERFQQAQEQANEALEEEARRRATTGVERPVYQGGKMVGHVTERSDTLLIFLMKGAMPEKYRERTETRQTGDVHVRVEIAEEEDWYGRRTNLTEQSHAQPGLN